MQYWSELEQARSALEKGHDIPTSALTSVVAQSWERCREQGLDPGASPRNVVISTADVQRRREEQYTCRRLALSGMQLLHSQIAGSNFMIAFADSEGFVIDTISDTYFSDSKAVEAIIPGSSWRESERGTNALGLSLISCDSVAVYGREHYFNQDAHLSCVAAPIFNASGNMVGVLDVSCADATREQHTHALVKMAATQVGNALFYQEQSTSYILSFHPRTEFLDTLATGLIAISGDGEIVSINRYGRAFLSGLPAVAGLHFDDVFDGQFGATMGKLLGGQLVQIRDRVGSGVFMACRQIARGSACSMSSVSLRKRPIVVHEKMASGFVCEDPVLLDSLKDLDRVTQLRMPIHVWGETGTGKELMANYIHQVSLRPGKFVAINCGAIPETLFISELFGHEKGAFTNASSHGAMGLVRSADRGTLFLDEIADIPLAAQTALLRFLDDMKVRPVGGLESHQVDVQIVSATNRDLAGAVLNRQFRADLLFRLNALTITLPPLRERRDFAAIVRCLVAELSPGTAITDAAIEKLRCRPWQGNIRELRNCLQLALVRRRHVDFISEDSFDKSLLAPSMQACPLCEPHTSRRRKCLEIRITYASTGRNVSEVARLLGLSRTTVYKHLR